MLVAAQGGPPLMRYLRAFGAFWYDFLVGDRWELFVGPILALLVARLLTWGHVPGALTGLILFVLVALIGTLSVAAVLREVGRKAA